ncbi:uncharacterized protein [Drosophila kikkawai]|uniref:Uncharacterized protein n=1 Tax=Drosophila kikkawai TaxID=30033 RepID=A0A6P4J6P7_DROKI|nr:uncharacterized protein LOC108085158 [Drosophila kikkawai]
MHLMCERLSAVFAGVVAGLWFAKTFPAEAPKKDEKKK